MAKKKLGKKHACYECGCKFYDMGRPKAICPKCGSDQHEAPKKDAASSARTTALASPSRPRTRRRRDEGTLESEDNLGDDENEKSDGLGDELSLMDDDILETAEVDADDED